MRLPFNPRIATGRSVRFEAVDVSVSVEMDFDEAALFGLGSGHAAALETGIGTDVTTDARDSTGREDVDQALAREIRSLALLDAQQVSARLSVRDTSRTPDQDPAFTPKDKPDDP